MQDVLKQYGSKELVDIVFGVLVKKEILNRIMTNKYANYFVQLLFKKVTKSQKEEILAMILTNFDKIFVSTAIHQIGTHCLQSFLEDLNPSLLTTLFLTHKNEE